MRGEVVIAVYRPKPGQEDALRLLVDEHVPLLRKLDLVTDRPVMRLRSRDAFLEIFEWRSKEAAGAAHDAPEVADLWKRMEEVATFPALGELEEAKTRFPHFRPVDGE